MTTLVDFDRLATFTDGDQAVTRELADLFMRTVAGYLEELGAALGRHDRWSAVAHGLKGACGNFGALAMAELAKEAEHAVPEQAILDRLEATFQSTRASLMRQLG